jgi:hypothetical protein
MGIMNYELGIMKKMRISRRSGYTLVLAGVCGTWFFWETDPHAPIGKWLIGVSVDAANQARVGTLVGLAGSVVALGIGLWLLTKRMV